jgi:hypothetical protein
MADYEELRLLITAYPRPSKRDAEGDLEEYSKAEEKKSPKKSKLTEVQPQETEKRKKKEKEKNSSSLL